MFFLPPLQYLLVVVWVNMILRIDVITVQTGLNTHLHESYEVTV